MDSFRIALDCMGGDFAPEEIVKGGILALKELNCEIIFVGKDDIIRKIAKKHKIDDITIVNSEDNIEMNSSPSSVLKRKNSSLYIASKLLRENKADALV